MCWGVPRVTADTAWSLMELGTGIDKSLTMREKDRGTHCAHHCSIGRRGRNDMDNGANGTRQHPRKNRPVMIWIMV